jgi:hypothetical protein
MVLAEKQGLVFQPDDFIDDPMDFPDMMVEASDSHNIGPSVPDAPSAEIPSTSITVSAKDMTSARNSFIFGTSPLGKKTKAALVAILVENEVPVATFDMDKATILTHLQASGFLSF